MNIKGTPTTVLHLPGMSAMADLAAAADKAGSPRSGGNAWAGSTFAEAIKRAREGDETRAAASDRMLERLERFSAQSQAFATLPAVAGGAPCVPAYLSNSPLAMRQRRRVLSQAAPVAVLVNGFYSAAVDHETIERRGAAVLALVRVLSASRPVSLYWFVGAVDSVRGKGRLGSLITLPIDTAPLDLARASWLLCSPEAFRRVHFPAHRSTIGTKEDTSIGWLGGHEWQQENGLAPVVAGLLGFSDYVATPGVLIGTTFKTDDAAAAWVEQEAAKITGIEV